VIGTIAAIVDVAGTVGLPLLFALIAIETMGIPVPGETALITAGILASKGKLPIEGVVAVAAGAAILGDNVGFLIGRHYGRRLLTAPGPLSTHRRRVIEIGEPFFDRHGPKAVFLGRFISGLRITSAWMAGVSRMDWPIFTFYNAAGGIVWAATFGLLAYYGGEHAESVVHTIGIAGVATVVVVGLALFLALRVRRRRAEALVDGAVARAEARDEARASGAAGD
jgi:membrane protein DedA with SNARE-associated domain